MSQHVFLPLTHQVPFQRSDTFLESLHQWHQGLTSPRHTVVGGVAQDRRNRQAQRYRACHLAIHAHRIADAQVRLIQLADHATGNLGDLTCQRQQCLAGALALAEARPQRHWLDAGWPTPRHQSLDQPHLIDSAAALTVPGQPVLHPFTHGRFNVAPCLV